MYWGVAWWVAGAAAFFAMYGEPEFTVWKQIGVILLAGILGFVCFYTGRWIWKDDKKPKQPNVQASDPASGGTGHSGTSLSGTALNGTTFTSTTYSGNIHTGTGISDPAKRGRTVLFNTSSTSGGGEAASNEPVTVDCPGCGAPVSVSPSSPGECEYCGNKVAYKR